MEIYHQYVRLRKHFGRHARFTDERTEMLADIRPNEEHAALHVVRNPMSTAVQCAPDMSEHEANTNAVVYTNRAMSHQEGGWPKDVDCTEADHTIRYRKKVEKDEDYIKTVVRLGTVVEELVKQNNAIDIYQEYFVGYAVDHSAEVPAAHTVTVLRDPSATRRAASYVSWHPDGSHKVLVSHSILAFQQQPPGMPLDSYVWDASNPNAPEAALCGTSQLVCAKFNLKDAALVGAGQYNGQVALFDMRKGSAPAEVTPVGSSHRDPVYDFSWLQSKTGSEAITVSTDGSALCWDVRRLAEPLDEVALREKGGDVLLGAVCLEYDPTAGPTKFMVGSEQGTVLSCNRKAKNPADRVGASYAAHHGPVVALRRNPFYPKFFVSLGDWCARLWNEDLRTALLTTRYHPTYITGGCWSPTRPGVLFATQMDGVLSVRDLFYKQSEPSLEVSVTSEPLTSLAVHEAGGLVAVGADDGAVTLLRLSAGLVDAAPNERQGISAMLERETLREKNLEKAVKEARIKARKEQARTDDAAASEHGSTRAGGPDMADLEAEFFAATGLEPPPRPQPPAPSLPGDTVHAGDGGSGAA